MENNDGERVVAGRGAASRVHAWLAPGQRYTITVDGVAIVIRLVERRGRRARVAVEAASKAPTSQR